MLNNRLGKFFTLTLFAVVALGMSFAVVGCGGSKKSSDDQSKYIKEIFFYPNGVCVENNRVVFSANKTIEAETIQAAEVLKSSSTYTFALVGRDSANNLRVMNNDKLVVGWENGANYSKYVELQSDLRTLKYNSMNGNTMNLVASYQAVTGGTPVQKTLVVSSVDNERTFSIDCYPGSARVDDTNANTVVDKDGKVLSPILSTVEVKKSASPYVFTCVAQYSDCCRILPNSDHMSVDWKNESDSDKATVDFDVTDVMIGYKKPATNMELEVTYVDFPGGSTSLHSTTLMVDTINE